MVGNGTCAKTSYCCTGDGWCDQGFDACGYEEDDDDPMVATDPVETLADDEGPCENGFRGAGLCDDPLLQCSEWGWCVPRKILSTATPVPTFVVNETSTSKPTSTPKPDDTTSSSVAIAGGVGVVAVTCGAAAAFFVYRLSKKRNAPHFMESGGQSSADAFVNISPIYEGSSAVKTNPIYEEAPRSTDLLL